MRREQVLKICANHFIQAEMSLLAMNEKAWIWTAMDASDETRNGTAVLEKFAVRFKEIDTAKDFEKVFNEAKVVKKQEVPEKKKESPKPSGKFSFGFNFEKEEEKSIEEAKKTLEEEDLEKALAEEEKSMEEETKATTTGWFSAVLVKLRLFKYCILIIMYFSDHSVWRWCQCRRRFQLWRQ